MICVDASVAAKWLLDEELSDRALTLLVASARSGEQIIAPPLLPIEVTNTLWKRMRVQDGITLEEAGALLANLLEVPVATHNPPELHQRALGLAATFGLPATYDAHYLALAAHFACDFWTDDRRLLRQIGDRLPFVRPLADFTPATET